MTEAQLTALLRRVFKAGLRRIPKKQKDATALLALSVATLDPDYIYDEREIDEHLTQWLARITDHQGDIDHVTWRRALVDGWFLRRATDGAIYRIKVETIEATLSPGARSIDPLTIFLEVAQAKAEREQAFRA